MSRPHPNKLSKNLNELGSYNIDNNTIFFDVKISVGTHLVVWTAESITHGTLHTIWRTTRNVLLWVAYPEISITLEIRVVIVLDKLEKDLQQEKLASNAIHALKKSERKWYTYICR